MISTVKAKPRPNASNAHGAPLTGPCCDCCPTIRATISMTLFCGVTCLNMYRPPRVERGDPNLAGPWIAHIKYLFSDDDADHILRWLAQHQQNPDVNINHALLLRSSDLKIGQDVSMVPGAAVVGPWSVYGPSPPAAFATLMPCGVTCLNMYRPPRVERGDP